jgi:hypothetical protein
VLCSYPVYLVLFGPARPSGQIRPALDVRADPLNAVLPTPVTVGGSAANSGHLNAYVGEQGGYLGVVVLLLLVVACVVSRSATVRVVAVLGLLTWAPASRSAGTTSGCGCPGSC